MRCVKVKVRLPHMKDSSPALFMSTLGLFRMFHVVLGCPSYTIKTGNGLVLLLFVLSFSLRLLWSLKRVWQDKSFWILSLLSSRSIPCEPLLLVYCCVRSTNPRESHLSNSDLAHLLCSSELDTDQISSRPQSERGCESKSIHCDFWVDGNYKVSWGPARTSLSCSTRHPSPQSTVVCFCCTITLKWSGVCTLTSPHDLVYFC